VENSLLDGRRSLIQAAGQHAALGYEWLTLTIAMV
jgi:hypothetical protein